MEITRLFERELHSRIRAPLNFMQVVIGPRQVGKTTGVSRVFSTYAGPKHFATADSPVPYQAEWLNAQWDSAISKGQGTLLVIDEIQKVEGWAEVCKLRFDAQRKSRTLQVVLLGSASLSLQEGLVSAPAGRFELIRVPHWGAQERERAFAWDLDTYLSFGGYPAAAELVGDFDRWKGFIRDSIIEPVLGRDISGLVKINKPALFRQLFRLVVLRPAQVISYQKLLGQLQDRGNAATIKHYLELFEGAFLLRCLERYSGNKLARISSSPKLIPLAPALSTAFLESEAELSDTTWHGHLFEAAVGARLLELPGQLYYWSEGNYEVDFVRVIGEEVIAYEVKSGVTHKAKSLEVFNKRYPGCKLEIIDKSKALSLFNLSTLSTSNE